MADDTPAPQTVSPEVAELTAVIVNQRRMGRSDAQITQYLLSTAASGHRGCVNEGCPQTLVAQAFLNADKIIAGRSGRAKWWIAGLVLFVGVGVGAYHFGKRRQITA